MAGKPSRGLADVVVASTAVSDIDGRDGRLSYRGYDIGQLAGTVSFEEVAYLLQRGTPPGRAELAAYRAELAAGQDLGPAVRASLPAVARAQPPMAALRTLVSLASADDPDAGPPGPDRAAALDGPPAARGARPAAPDPAVPPDPAAGRRTGARLTGQQPALVAAIHAAQAPGGAPPPGPEPGLGLAANFLLQVTGQVPAPRAAEIFDTCLVLQADHLMAASTFAARVCAATLADMHAAVVAALAALSGRLHGSANEQVMRALAAARATGGDPVAAAAAQVAEQLGRGEPVTGFGHRGYRGPDPRAELLRELSAELAAGGDDTYHRMATRVEDIVAAEQDLHPNADFYAATVYHYLGLPPGLATPVLSVARMAGWTAHIIEQHADNRLIRPGSAYIGESGLTWIPVADR
jgi:citrate synthase